MSGSPKNDYTLLLSRLPQLAVEPLQRHTLDSVGGDMQAFTDDDHDTDRDFYPGWPRRRLRPCKRQFFSVVSCERWWSKWS